MKQEQQRVIYLITNNINGKQYVGQTRNFKKRMYAHFYTVTDDTFLKRTMIKYGSNNFTSSIIKECKTDEELDFWETYFIDRLETVAPKGYNLTYGGDRPKNVFHESKNLYWTTDKIIEASKKYNSIMEFSKNEQGAYTRARKLKILPEIRKINNWIPFYHTYTFEEILQKIMSTQCTGRNNFKKTLENEYQYSLKRGWIDIFADRCNWKNLCQSITFERCIKEAKEHICKCKYDFKKAHQHLYSFCLKHNLISKLALEMGWPIWRNR